MARTPREPERHLSRGRRIAFLAITLLIPAILLAMVEGVLRLTWRGGAIPVFAPFDENPDRARIANRQLGRRYFADEAHPPVPIREPFAVDKPARGIRIFALGESSAAGFPYPRNVLFSRLVRDAMRDAFPGDSIEVVNLGLAATNSYTLLDILDEVLDERPDAILVYAGHNEYYGALGAGSAIGNGLPPSLVRATLRLQRLRTVLLLRNAIARLRRASRPDAASGGEAATFMETVARDQRIVLGGPEYRRGVHQFEDNLRRFLKRCRGAGVPVFVGSLTSNLRDLRPFVSDANQAPGGASGIFTRATTALTRGDTAMARTLFVQARDRDVVRFRAPSEFNDVIARVVRETGARYVPVAEAFDAASPGGIPGSELFLEHVHPNEKGYALLGRVYTEALRDHGWLGRRPTGALRPWETYVEARRLTSMDELVARHTARTLTTRWPFVPIEAAQDYRGTYRPSGLVDSLALMVSRGGIRWEVAKALLASSYEQRRLPDSAVAEYQGLMRDRPWDHFPFRGAAQTLLSAGRTAAAEPFLDSAFRLSPRPDDALVLGTIAVARRDARRAIAFLEQGRRMRPGDPRMLYQLSLAYGMARDLEAARVTASELHALAPDYPGLAEWRRLLGVAP